jgi:uncharacterized protein (TIGR01777 family)
MKWVARFVRVDPNWGFADVQESGPFTLWYHEHRMTALPKDRAQLEDHLTYKLPFGPLGRLFGGAFARRKLRRLFFWRHAIMCQDLARFSKEVVPMRVLVTGSSGLIGKALISAMKVAGHDMVRAVRKETAGEGEIAWCPDRGFLDKAALEGIDAVVHLAGDGIADGRWNASKKKRLRDSRIGPTSKLCEDLAQMKRRPSVLVSASAIGVYGSRGDEILKENSPLGSDFLAEICKDWESATAPAKKAGIRVVNARIGVVLSSRGGALKQMLPPFRVGLGGRLGPGTQYFSWITLNDAVDAVRHLIDTDSISGPINLCTPTPVNNLVFTKTLGRVLNRATIFPFPAFAARLVFGEVADGLLLCSQRVDSSLLSSHNFSFTYPTLEPALRHLLGRP